MDDIIEIFVVIICFILCFLIIKEIDKDVDERYKLNKPKNTPDKGVSTGRDKRGKIKTFPVY